MEALQDISWLRYLYTAVQREHFSWKGFRVVTIVVPSSSLHHHERFKYRMLVFESSTITPVIALNVEDDFMGSWCMTVQHGNTLHVVERFDQPPDYQQFRARSLQQLEKLLREGSTPMRAAKRRGSAKKSQALPSGSRILPFRKP